MINRLKMLADNGLWWLVMVKYVVNDGDIVMINNAWLTKQFAKMMLNVVKHGFITVEVISEGQK